MVLAYGIGKPLLASKNTLSSKLNNKSSRYQYSQNEGLKSEEKVIQFIQQEGWILLFQRLKTKIAEIDLVFEKKGRIKIIEVKKLNNNWRSFERVSDQQVNKLILNQIFLSNQFQSYAIEANICWVDSNGKVSVVEIN